MLHGAERRSSCSSVAHAKEWPDTQGLRIVVAERAATLADPSCTETFADSGAPKWDEDGRVLTLFVAKGRIVRLRYASFVHKAFIDTLGLSDWANSGGERQFVRDMAQAGCGWVTTPYRSLVLVHATQQPVCLPEFLGCQLVARSAITTPCCRAAMRMHGPSTGKFEIEADWKEWFDHARPSQGPSSWISHGQLGEIQLPENFINVFSLGPVVDAQQPAEGKQSVHEATATSSATRSSD